MNDPWMEIFRAGDYGAKGNYTLQDLDTMIANYDPAKHEAPLVLGHPENDAPALGWVESLKRVGSVLMAKVRQVAPKLEELISSGAFKKRSISFYREPQLMLRHVGFLGATPPEVKGLADVKLADGQRSIVTFRDGAFATVEFSGRATTSLRFTDSPSVPADPRSIEIANAAMELQSKRKISYGEALTLVLTAELHFTETPVVKVDQRSVAFAEDAQQLVIGEGIAFGEALARVHTREMRFTDLPWVPADPESIERARMAEDLVRDRGISYGEALSLVLERS